MLYDPVVTRGDLRRGLGPTMVGIGIGYRQG